MRRISSLILLVIILLLPVTSFACGGFAIVSPPGTYFRTDPETNVFIWFRNKTQTTVVEPAYQGNAQSFAMVMPFPSQPSVERAPKDLFAQLDDLTSKKTWKIEQSTLGFRAPSLDMFPSVQVVERKDVGDYSVTVLKAGDGSELYGWLQQNGFEVKESAKENFDYYIKKGNGYFAAMKANLPKDRLDSNGNVEGRLKPIAFTYQTDKPYLAHRIFRDTSEMETTEHSEDKRSYNLYILSDRMYVVPGTEVVFSNPITKETLQDTISLLRYNAEGQWLTRSTITLDHTTADEDVYPQRLSENVEIYAYVPATYYGNEGTPENITVFNANDTPVNAGVIHAEIVNPSATITERTISIAGDEAVVTSTSTLTVMRIAVIVGIVLLLALLLLLIRKIKWILSLFNIHDLAKAIGSLILGVIISILGSLVIGLLSSLSSPLGFFPESEVFVLFLLLYGVSFLAVPMYLFRKQGWERWKRIIELQFIIIAVCLILLIGVFGLNTWQFMIEQYIEVLLP